MIWPPIKAWTCKSSICGQAHFVAIDYGGNLLDGWVILMSVLDSSLVLKLSSSQLFDTSNWECGWDDISISNLTELVDDKSQLTTIEWLHPSIDSGLTVPITKDSIRSWFGDS